jgi:hypothetical protein
MSDVAIEKVARGTVEDRVLQKALKDFHPEFDTYDVKAAMEFAVISEEARMEGEYPVKEGGLPQIARTKPTTDRERRYGAPDLIVTVDQFQWEALTDPQRLALMDRMLSRFVLAKKKNGDVKVDREGRPTFSKRPYDVSVGLYRDVAERHGEDSIEVVLVNQIVDEPANVQAFFQFSDFYDAQTATV